ncbi:Protein TIC 22, chloroplastic [Dionaea muscipula]
MDSPKPVSGGPLNPPPSVSTFIHHHFHRFGSELASRLEDAKRLAGNLISNWPPRVATATATSANSRAVFPSPASSHSRLFPPFASIAQAKNVFDVALNSDQVAKTLMGTSVYTVSNSNNEFVLISDPTGGKSISLLCFRREDAEAFLAQVQSRRKELRIQAKVVPITLDQVYLLKVEGIAFRFLPDPIQIQNAIKLKAADNTGGFDGVPVFQSDLLVVKKKRKQFFPIYFRKEDIEKELSSRMRGTRVSQYIAVGSLEDVLRKMETSEKNSGWEKLIFIPPGKNYSEHIEEVANA